MSDRVITALQETGTAQIVGETLADVVEAAQTLGLDPARVRVLGVLRLGGLDQWCPVCKTSHEDVGEQTDDGRTLIRPCPRLARSHGLHRRYERYPDGWRPE